MLQNQALQMSKNVLKQFLLQPSDFQLILGAIEKLKKKKNSSFATIFQLLLYHWGVGTAHRLNLLFQLLCYMGTA